MTHEESDGIMGRVGNKRKMWTFGEHFQRSRGNSNLNVKSPLPHII